MKNIALTTLFIAAASLLGCVAGPGEGLTQSNARGTRSLSPEAGDFGLEFMREEEKLARDVYLALGDKWGHRTFKNIARSEQRHMDAIAGLLDAHGISDPVGDNPRGVFSNPDLQTLYDDLTAKGQTSLAEALQVGALIEEIDISDLVGELDEDPPEDIARVYRNLLRGSHNHLRAFDRSLGALGEDYTPTVLDQGDYDTIINSEPERGHGGGHGRRGGGGGGGRGGGR